jgi:hypothetical protein
LPELAAAERSFFIKHYPVQIFILSYLTHFVCVKSKVMAFFCFFRVEFKKVNGFSAAATIPAIGKQHTADICKYCVDRKFSFHVVKIL